MSVKLVMSELLQRKVRLDDIDDLGRSTITLAIKALEEGKLNEAREFIKYTVTEGKPLHDLYCDWSYAWYNYIAEKYGEEALGEASWKSQEVWLDPLLKALADINEPLIILALLAEFMRAHRSGPEQIGDCVIYEEKDRFVMEFDPCGSGGRMRRGDSVDGTPPRTGPPYNLGVTKNAYPWTWGKKGVCYYCIHCCINQIRSIEVAGYPIWITEYIDDPSKPCRWIVYKTPDLIPDIYWTCVGKEKPKMKK